MSESRLTTFHVEQCAPGRDAWVQVSSDYLTMREAAEFAGILSGRHWDHSRLRIASRKWKGGEA